MYIDAAVVLKATVVRMLVHTEVARVKAEVPAES
jgi:hypothetical protein